ncbi:MAG: hypothetical protein HY331_02625 [Chloroflexi bacterium]|nr:hypothetical protein [Chloroflexota bacterium]
MPTLGYRRSGVIGRCRWQRGSSFGIIGLIDGWQFARAYRDGRAAVAPVVVATAAQDATRRASEIEADGCLGKPFDLEELLATVQRFNPSSSINEAVDKPGPP